MAGKSNNFKATAFKVPCPICEAGLGEPCTAQGIGICHPERWKLAYLTIPSTPLKWKDKQAKKFRANTTRYCKDGNCYKCRGYKMSHGVAFRCGCTCHNRKLQDMLVARKMKI